MCGIAGFTYKRHPLPEGTLSAAMQALLLRGPDQQGTFVGHAVSLAATRLRVMGMQGGDQPMFSADGDLVLLFNGEIANYRELRAELEGCGARFETRGDTEVVLAAYVAWGEECFARFRGMFAIAFWVQREQRLVLARDRMGIKPLYWMHRDGELSFGSELRCLLAHRGLPRRLDREAMDCYLSMNFVPAPRTLLEGMRKVMPGHVLTWQAGEVQGRSYLPVVAGPGDGRQKSPFHGLREQEAMEVLDGLLISSVAENLDSDVPVGMWLSGGLDSSTLLHYAAQQAQTPLRTFSITFRGRSFDDGGYVREMAERYGTRHEELDLNPEVDLVRAIEVVTGQADEPHGDAGAIPLWFLAQMTRRQVTVALSGEGADELFGGYLTYRADRYRSWMDRVPRSVKRAALACAGRMPVSNEKIGLDYKVRRFFEGTLLPADQAHVFWNGTFTQEEKAALLCGPGAPGMESVLAGMTKQPGLEAFLRFDQRNYLPDDILFKVDRISMAHSLEVRPPFLDDRIVAFARGLPEAMKLRGGTSKYILRRTMAGKLPQTVLRRPKIGLDIPIHEWLRGPLRTFLLSTLTESAVAATGLFHWNCVQQLLDLHLQRKANVGYHLWGLMTLMIWIGRWDVDCSAAQAEGVCVLDEGVCWSR